MATVACTCCYYIILGGCQNTMKTFVTTILVKKIAWFFAASFIVNFL